MFPGVSWLQANLKKFMEYVQMLNAEKVCRLLEKGLDPNFHDPDTGGEPGFSGEGRDGVGLGEHAGGLGGICAVANSALSGM